MKLKHVIIDHVAIQNKIKIEAKRLGVLEKEKLKDRLALATPVRTGRARAGWYVDSIGNIVNNVPYISKLNAGSSQQAPAHFVEMVLLSTGGIRPRGIIVKINE